MIRFHEHYGSLEKLQNGIRNLCTLVVHYLSPAIVGDFRWVEIYKAYYERGIERPGT